MPTIRLAAGSDGLRQIAGSSADILVAGPDRHCLGPRRDSDARRSPVIGGIVAHAAAIPKVSAAQSREKDLIIAASYQNVSPHAALHIVQLYFSNLQKILPPGPETG